MVPLLVQGRVRARVIKVRVAIRVKAKVRVWISVRATVNLPHGPTTYAG